jgi:hypothetical protein
VLLAFVACYGFPTSLLAQIAPRITSAGGLFEAGAASAAVDGYERSPLGDLAASLWGSFDRISGVGTVSLSRFESGSTTAYADLHGAVTLSSDPRNISSFKFGGGGGSYHGRTTSRYTEASLLLGRTTPEGRAAAWFEAGAGRAGGDRMAGTTYGKVGGVLRSTSAMLSAELDYTSVRAQHYTDGLIHAQWAPFGAQPLDAARFVAGIDAGLRSAGDGIPGRAAWLGGVATLRLVDPVSLVAYAGTQPADPVRATPGVTFTSLALRVTIGPSGTARSPPPVAAARATSVSPELADGDRVLTVLLPDARTVEVMGDFTQWQPVAMSRTAPGIWQARLPIAPGSHRTDIRPDSGAWKPPPGIPVAADEFGGSVGILVVQ